MNRRLLILLPLALLLSACDDEGLPNTDTEAIMFGAVLIVLLAAVAAIFIAIVRR